MDDNALILYTKSMWTFLDPIDDALFLPWIEVAKLRVDQGVFAQAYYPALAALLAHHIVLADPDASFGGDPFMAGNLTARSTMSMSESFSSTPGSSGQFKDSDLTLTKPGNLFISLLRTRARANVVRFIHGN